MDESKALLRMNVLHVVSTLASGQGGPSRSVPALCEGLARRGATVKIITSDTTRVYGAAVRPDPRLVATETIASVASDRLRIIWSPSFRGAVARELSRSGVGLLHAHGAWLPSIHASCALARSRRIPYVLSPRGMMSSWALRHRRWKKRLAWIGYQRADTAGATLLHATAPAEAEDLRALGLRQPIAVIPNGVSLPAQQLARRRTEPRIALFLSRIHPTKGVLNLVRAWAQARPAGWRLWIVGPNEEDHADEVEAEIRSFRLGDVVEVRPAVDGADKWRTFAEASLFILPTFSENFGIAIAEALASGVPVITTQAAPWQQLVTSRCGWWIPIGVEALVAAIRQATVLGDDEREEMGRRGRTLAEQRYDWVGIAEQMIAAYRWVVGNGPKPDSVWLA